MVKIATNHKRRGWGYGLPLRFTVIKVNAIRRIWAFVVNLPKIEGDTLRVPVRI